MSSVAPAVTSNLVHLADSKGHTRSMSDAALCGDIFDSLSTEMLLKIRCLALSYFDANTSQLLSNSKQPNIQIPLKENQIRQAINETIQEVAEKRFGADRKDLFQKAQEEFKKIYENKRTVTVPREDLRSPSFSDDRLKNWTDTAYAKATLEFEKRRGTQSVEIPPSKQSTSCYRYALLQAGISLERIFSPKTFEEILNGFEPVSEGQEGDLVLFFHRKKYTHLGVYSDGKILSKEGNNTPVAYLRPLEDLAPEYGDRVLYLRQKMPLVNA